MIYQRPLVKATFDESKGDMAGFAFRFRRPSVGNLVTLSMMDDMSGEGSFGEREIEILNEVFSVLADRIVDWNLADEDGAPIPTTEEAIASQDIDFVMELIKAMVAGASGVSDPLPGPSSAGQSWAEEALIPMEFLSPSLPS